MAFARVREHHERTLFQGPSYPPPRGDRRRYAAQHAHGAAAPRPRVRAQDKVAATVRSIGELPSPLSKPSGCAFSSRCPLATDRCHEETPALRVLDDGRAAACHYAETAQVGAA